MHTHPGDHTAKKQRVVVQHTAIPDDVLAALEDEEADEEAGEPGPSTAPHPRHRRMLVCSKANYEVELLSMLVARIHLARVYVSAPHRTHRVALASMMLHGWRAKHSNTLFGPARALVIPAISPARPLQTSMWGWKTRAMHEYELYSLGHSLGHVRVQVTTPVMHRRRRRTHGTKRAHPPPTLLHANTSSSNAPPR